MPEYAGNLAIGLGIAILAVVYVMLYRRFGFKQRGRMALVSFLILVVGGGFYFTMVQSLPGMMRLGLDLEGGVDIVLQAEDTPEAPVTDEAMYAAVETIRRRVDLLGLAEPMVQRSRGSLGQERIIVQIPGVTDPEQAIETIGRTAMLRFVDEDGEVSVTGAHLVTADVGMRGQEAVVTLELNNEGARLFREATEKNLHRVIHIVLDDETLSSPVVSSVIPDGQAEITGYGSVEEAWHLAVMLRSGALPLELTVVENRTVSATLGEESVNRSVRAGLIGISAIILYLLAFYRLPGLLADLSLALYLLLLMAVLVGLDATITLPGIAGIILSIGMAVDANVIIFERIKEELKTGRTLRAAVDSGFSNALRAIIDANVTTLLAAGVLFWLGTDRIRGFAITLSVGIIVSMFTAIVVTRFILRSLINAGLFRNTRMYFGIGGER